MKDENMDLISLLIQLLIWIDSDPLSDTITL
jgi:hypothetical protein